MKNRTTITKFIGVLFLVAFFGCKPQNKSAEQPKNQAEISKEAKLYRPNFHFTPKANWMNDPNGMFYLNGTYHLYFQYYPDGNVWGPMHWGHATSTDLITWEEQPIALYPDKLGLIFSGSAVVDTHNTSGFGKDGVAPVIAMYTYHNMDGEKAGTIDFQTQAIAYSLDEGMTWTKYDKNPVISNPGIKDFRDPKVIWDTNRDQWIMVLAAADKILFYSSKDLKKWQLESEFGKEFGQHGGVWECPDLFPIKVEGTNDLKWALIVSINPAAPNGGSGTQYFIGDFDGSKFTLDPNFKTQLQNSNAVWLDYGRDNYAGVTWSNIPKKDGRHLFIGWMSNWQYARDVPTETWRSAMTVARELKLVKDNERYILSSLPVSEFSKYVSKTIVKDSIVVTKKQTIISNKDIDLSRLKLNINLIDGIKHKTTFLLHNSVGDSLSFGLYPKNKTYFLNRKKSGQVNFANTFANTISKAPMKSLSKTLKVQALLDKTSIEVFFNDGETVMTEIFFPNAPFETLSVLTADERLVLKDVTIEQLKKE